MVGTSNKSVPEMAIEDMFIKQNEDMFTSLTFGFYIYYT